MKKKVPYGRRAKAAEPPNSDDRCESASICAFSETDLRQLADAIGIAGRARALMENLETLDVATARALDSSNKHIGHVIAILESAERLAESIIQGGGEPKSARRGLVQDLADIYYDASGKPPTRRHDPIGVKDYGPFLDFVRATLQLIDPGAVKGVEHDIRTVVSIWQKPTPRSA
jgi:hypothetical protein